MASSINAGVSSPIHFHIRWGGTRALDFFPFSSREEADESAKLWVRHDETYSIEQLGGSCEKCAELLRKAANPSIR